MRTKYFVMNSIGKIAKTTSRVISVVAMVNNLLVVKSKNTQFVFGCVGNITDNILTINKVLNRHGILLCKNCGRDHSNKFTYCPWCGQYNVMDPKVSVHNNVMDPKVSVHRDVYMADDEVYAARYQGKVAAIKLYRTRTGYDLKRCKEDVEQYMEDCGYKFYNG